MTNEPLRRKRLIVLLGKNESMAVALIFDMEENDKTQTWSHSYSWGIFSVKIDGGDVAFLVLIGPLYHDSQGVADKALALIRREGLARIATDRYPDSNRAREIVVKTLASKCIRTH